MENEFTLQTLLKQLLKRAWIIVAVAIIGAVVMFVGAKKQHVQEQYSAARMMFIGHDTTKSPRPEQRFNADLLLLNSYKEVATNRAIISQTVRNLEKSGMTDVNWNDVKSSVKITTKYKSLSVWASAKQASEKKAVAYVNAYSDAFAAVAPKLIPGMPKPALMPTALAGQSVSDSKPISTPKALLFGGGAGIGVGVVLVLIMGVFDGLRPNKKL
ncbi:Wzz/FepE/Etk N-terminal domain-containing protein [Weissella cibaria]|uniref:Wzz/FepE/Etk N-terminal domain-containing protein n=1 Tax=Weissella cibaria TaxID=137591 RepID=UPI0021AF50E0|nr:Wzz/FepE/Etk N-terminal domain-containing protein [Weissella cibaria]MCT0021152.1 hypothetical protein [Weissella cibaria]